MKIKLDIQYNDEPDKDQEQESKFLLNIHKRFPNAVWQKANDGYEIFI